MSDDGIGRGAPGFYGTGDECPDPGSTGDDIGFPGWHSLARHFPWIDVAVDDAAVLVPIATNNPSRSDVKTVATAVAGMLNTRVVRE